MTTAAKLHSIMRNNDNLGGLELVTTREATLGSSLEGPAIGYIPLRAYPS